MPNIVIDTDKCKSCGICIEACPNGLISFSNQVNKKGEVYVQFDSEADKCTGCALCAISCPEIAIKEVTK